MLLRILRAATPADKMDATGMISGTKWFGIQNLHRVEGPPAMASQKHGDDLSTAFFRQVNLCAKIGH